MKYLATFAVKEDPSTLNEAKEEAVRAVIEFIKSPDMFQVEFLCLNFKSVVLACFLYRIDIV